MQRDLKAKWIAALRSGEYRQATGSLQSGDGYCCLGVLCRVGGHEINEVFGNDANYEWTRDQVGGVGNQRALTAMNDSDKRSFAEIADWIDANIPADDTRGGSHAA